MSMFQAPDDPWLGISLPIPLARPATPITVARYDGSNGYDYLPSFHCLKIRKSQGTDPGTAIFRYAFDGYDPQSPQSAADALDYGNELFDHAVKIGDQIVVIATRPDGTPEFLIYCEPIAFRLELANNIEMVYVTCQGMPRKLWQTPIQGAIVRDATKPASPTANTQTDDILVFNPKGKGNATLPNCTPDSGDATNRRGEPYPVILDPTPSTQDNPIDVPEMPAATSGNSHRVTGSDPKDAQTPAGIARAAAVAAAGQNTFWTLSKAARYLIFSNNDDPKNKWVLNPASTDLTEILTIQVPNPNATPGANGAAPTNPFLYEQIAIRERPHTGRDWPTVLHDYLRAYGFSMTFYLETNQQNGQIVPQYVLVIWDSQNGASEKAVVLQPRGSYLDPNLSNVGRANISRNIEQVINKWTVYGGKRRYEASFILTPAYPMLSADGANAVAIDKYRNTAFNPKNTPLILKSAYRKFIYGEAGQGYYLIGTNTKITAATPLDAIFNDTAPGNPPPVYPARPRKPLHQLLTADAAAQALRFEVAVSTNYAGVYPGLWDGTGTWQKATGGFKLLDNEIGIELDCENPNEWHIGIPPNDTSLVARADGTIELVTANAPYPDGVINVIEALCSGTSTFYPPFVIRLTCAIEGDTCLKGIAQSTANGSIIADVIERHIEARDRFKYDTVCANSAHSAVRITVRDDTNEAKAEAQGYLTATENGILDGPIVIPRFTNFYEVGDLITAINGRGIGFRTDSLENGSTPIYPVVETIEWDFDGKQTTTLFTSDESQERHSLEWKINRARHH